MRPGGRSRLRSFVTRNPPLIAVVLGLLAPDALAPQALVDVSHVLAVGLAPLGFFALGAILAGEAEHGVLGLPPSFTLLVLERMSWSSTAGVSLTWANDNDVTLRR